MIKTPQKEQLEKLYEILGNLNLLWTPQRYWTDEGVPIAEEMRVTDKAKTLWKHRKGVTMLLHADKLEITVQDSSKDAMVRTIAETVSRLMKIKVSVNFV